MSDTDLLETYSFDTEYVLASPVSRTDLLLWSSHDDLLVQAYSSGSGYV